MVTGRGARGHRPRPGARVKGTGKTRANLLLRSASPRSRSSYFAANWSRRCWRPVSKTVPNTTDAIRVQGLPWHACPTAAFERFRDFIGTLEYLARIDGLVFAPVVTSEQAPMGFETAH